MVEAIANNAPGLEDVDICLEIDHGQPYAQILGEVVQTLSSASSAHKLESIRVGVYAPADMPVSFDATLRVCGASSASPR